MFWSDAKGLFDVLSTIIGEHGAFAILLAGAWFAGAVLYYWRRLRTGDDYEGDTARASAAREEHTRWRTRLLAEGGHTGRAYARLLGALLSRVDRFFAAETERPVAGFDLRYANWTVMDRAVGFAYFYPLLSILIIWAITGVGDASVTTLGMRQVPLWLRSFVALLIVFMFVSGFRFFRWSDKRFGGSDTSTRRDLLIAISGVCVFVAVFWVVLTAAGQVAGTGVILPAMLGYVALQIRSAPFLFVLALALSLLSRDWDVLWLIALFVGFAFYLMNVPGGRDSFVDQPKHRIVFDLACLALLPLAFLLPFAPIPLSSGRLESWLGLLILCILLPAINAVFDIGSLVLTRALVAKGQARGGWWPLLFGALDVIGATLLLLGTLVACILGIHGFNLLAQSQTGQMVLDMRNLLDRLTLPGPPDPSVWWIYVTVFTTFIPSLVNLSLGALSVLRGLPGLSRWTATHLVPEDPCRITHISRLNASLVLGAQFWVATFGALLAGLLMITLVLTGLDALGFGLKSVADGLLKQLG